MTVNTPRAGVKARGNTTDTGEGNPARLAEAPVSSE